jgi:cytochrome P450
MTTQLPINHNPLPKASLGDTLATLAEVVLPTVARGAILQHPRLMRAAARLHLESRAIRRMRKLRATYGDGPLMLRVPFRAQAMILAPDHVNRVLDGTPSPFAPTGADKRAALAHQEPKAALMSNGADRAERRRFTEDVLDIRQDVHCMAGHFLTVVEEEMQALRTLIGTQGEVTWDAFNTRWHAVVRRMVLGDAARDDHELADMLAQLRGNAKWAILHSSQKGLLDSLHARVETHLQRAEPGSLAAMIAATPRAGASAPSHQVAHWLFAFDPIGMAVFRALALLATHPPDMARARQEVADNPGRARRNLPFLRACLLEALRLWPTTSVIQRETAQDTHWGNGTMPKGTSVMIYAPFFHRDEEALADANNFHPAFWMNGPRQGGWPLLPFGGGKGICPARNLVPVLGSATLACLLDASPISLSDSRGLAPGQPIPGLLDACTLRFRYAP